MTTDANKLECIQQKFAAVCYNCFLPQVHYTYSNTLEYLKLYTLHKRRHHLNALFLIQVYLGSKFCLSILETVSFSPYSAPQRLFFCSMFALQLKTVLLLDALQLLILSAGTSISFEDKMFPLNVFYYKQDTGVCYLFT
jgi:hypothetical protein